MARAALNLSLEHAAALAGLNRNSIQRFEAGNLDMRPHNVAKLRAAYEETGVEFLGTTGVQIEEDAVP